jgi:uncharacterized protein YgiM (DUF1202 family)
MESQARFAIIVSLTILITAGLAAQPVTPPAPAASDINEAQAMALPYIAEITTDDVYVRSGPGVNYYFCGKLSKGDKVRVVATKFSWSQIAPPQGSFSWISKQYVQVDPTNKLMGTVTGDAVRVYAGSDAVLPMNSTSMQLKLNKGDKVILLAEEKDDYYKISPPEGAYLWVSTDYTKPLTSLAPTTPVTTSITPAAPADVNKTVIKPGAKPAAQTPQPGTTATVAPATVAPSPEDEILKKYNAVKEKVEAERAKPVEDQNYVEMKKELSSIAGNAQAPKTVGYAKSLAKQIERFELARQVGDTVKAQDAQFEQNRQEIDNARDTKLAGLHDLSRFAIIGIFETSSTLPKLFRIMDADGKTVCYAAPAGPAETLDFTTFIQKRVGLVGTIEPNTQIGGALVRFTEIAEIQ